MRARSSSSGASIGSGSKPGSTPNTGTSAINQSDVGRGHASAPLAVELPPDLGGDVWISTDTSRPLAVETGAGTGQSLARGPLPAVPYWFAWANFTLHPHPRAETRLNVSYNQSAWPSRFAVDERDTVPDPLARQFLLSELSSPALSVTLRQLLVLSPRLTLQGYAQLYSSYGRYHRFRLATAHDGRIGFGDLGEPLDAPESFAGWDNPDFRSASLNVNVVLRWEYRLGSTLYLVYLRSQAERGYPDAPHNPSPPYTIRPVGLGAGPTVDTFLVKWSYWWSR